MVAVDLRNYKNRHSLKSKIGRMIWSVVWIFLFYPTPRWCLNRWRRCLLRFFGAKIGRNVRILGSVKIWQPWNLTIGDNCWIGGGVSLYSVDKITIGANVVVSEDAYLCTASHDVLSSQFELVAKPVSVGDFAWVCARAIVLPGRVIGNGAVVGAGAVVASDVAPWAIVAGNPARQVGTRE